MSLAHSEPLEACGKDMAMLPGRNAALQPHVQFNRKAQPRDFSRSTQSLRMLGIGYRSHQKLLQHVQHAHDRDK